MAVLNAARGRPPALWALLAGCLLAMLAGCGGGSSGGSSSGATATPPAASTPATSTLPTGSNVVPVTVEAGPGNNVNIPYVTVTVCVPGSNTCKDIDHVLLDTGSTGLRLFASMLNAAPALSLPAHTINNSATITECAQFLNALAWGAVKVADVAMGGERASSVPIQLMDTSYPSALNAVCGSSPIMAQTSGTNLDKLSANGILGVSLFANDGQHYFNCANPTGACQIFPSAALQVQNPVGLFTSDNNGVLIQMPTLTAAGASSAKGALIFGVGTQGNNALDAANVVPVNVATGYFTTTYNGKAIRNSFIDSGSNGLYFNDPSLSTNCSTAAFGFYCPSATQTLSASITLAAGRSASVSFSVANADTLFRNNNYAFNNLGGTLNASSFDWGLPFFFGRSVFTVIEGHSVGTTAGPFYAFTN